MSSPYLWWQTGTIYQIYPRSFQDSNGDGIGDLAGVIERLDDLNALGVDAIWLSPIYPSPMADFGYDIADYCNIDPMFGSLDDFDRLVAAVHERGMKIILDYVPNHTSSEHAWFREARSSRDNPKRDWYVWADPAADGGPPNNWLAYFGGPAWTFDARTGQYYLHQFLPEQPDLNWRNPTTRAAMYDVLRFWMRRGVDGFRVDVIWLLVEDAALRDNPLDPNWDGRSLPRFSQLQTYTEDQPETRQIVTEMRRVLDEYPERMMVGEIYMPIERLVTYYGTPDEPGCHLPFNFQLISLPWKPQLIAQTIEQYEAALPPNGWPNWVLSNHDQPRVASRVGDAQARIAALLLLTLRGTPTLYYGDEIGMHNGDIPQELVQDPQGKNIPGTGRDPERTPMQWNATPGAGFTTGTPWLPISADAATLNVASERQDPHSILSLYQQLLALRHATAALIIGSYRTFTVSEQVLVYLREYEDERFLIALNFSEQPQQIALTDLEGTIRLSTTLDRQQEPISATLDLAESEGVIIQLVPKKAK